MSVLRAKNPRYVIALALLLAGSLIALAGPALGSEEDDLEFEQDQAVVKLSEVPGADYPALAEAVAEDFDVDVETRLPGGGGRFFVFALDLGSDEALEAETLSADGRVEYAEVNYTAEPPGGDARFRAREESTKAKAATNGYAMRSLGISCARAAGATGAGATVAVLDTGADLNHPRLEDNFAGVPRHDFIANEGEGDPSPTPGKGPMAGHGTHVAGIVDLVAPEAKIMPLRVLDGGGDGNAVAIVKAIAFAGENGADVINLSLSTPDASRVVEDYLDEARADGMVVAAAAGNDGSSVMQYPAANNTGNDGLLAVTSVDKDHTKSRFASFGPWVDVAAPGNAIRSAYPTGGYANLSGTSMSTPFVAGQAALLHAQDPARSPAMVEGLIGSSANPLDALNPAYAGMLGAGEVDAGASVAPASCS